MYRRIVSLSTTLGAILILLAHASVPHHQYGKQSCTFNSMAQMTICCEEHADLPNHSHPSHHNNHSSQHDHHGMDCCELAEQIIFLPVENRLLAHCINDSEVATEQTSHHEGFDTGHIRIPMPGFLNMVKRKNALITCCLFTTVSQHGLRAPPSC